jgi:predicted nucleic acid-binding protein
MPRAGRKTYYWDTSCFIAWVDGGKGHPKEVLAGLEEIAKEVTDNKANLCTSVMLDTEILAGKLTPEQATKLQDIFKRKNVVKINMDSRISQKSSEIRNYYNSRGIKISSPDAIHLATALIYGVDEFHTLDGDGKQNKLLRLNGNVAGQPLHIRVPLGQRGLFDGIANLDAEPQSGGNDAAKAIAPSTTNQESGVGPSGQAAKGEDKDEIKT